MKILKKNIIALILVVCTILAVGCGKSNSASDSGAASDKKEVKQEAPVTLTISAAASLKDALGEIKELYSKDKANVTLTYNFGASGSLQQQIEQGAPADIFISAGAKQMDALKKKSLLVDDTMKNLLQNEVVLIVPKDNSTIKDFNDLAGDAVKKVALGEPKSVPAGQYAEETLTSLKILDKVKVKTTYGNDVKQVLAWVESGNADAGIVYATDAKISKNVKVVANAPDKSHSPVIYPEAVIKGSKNQEAAKAFLKYLSEDKAIKVFEKYGFTVVK